MYCLFKVSIFIQYIESADTHFQVKTILEKCCLLRVGLFDLSFVDYHAVAYVSVKLLHDNSTSKRWICVS